MYMLNEKQICEKINKLFKRQSDAGEMYDKSGLSGKF